MTPTGTVVRTKWLVLSVLLLTAAAPAAVRAEPTPGYPAIQRAFLREDFAATAMLAREFLVQYPHGAETPRVWLWLVLSLDKLQRAAEALDQLDRLKERLTPSDSFWAEVLYWEGDISRRTMELSRAKGAFQRLLEQYPGSNWAAQGQLGLGLVYFHQQAFEQAISHFHEVGLRRATTPVALDALLFEGLCQFRLKRFDDAVRTFRPLLVRLKDRTAVTQASFYLGESLSALERFDEAALAYQRASLASELTSWSRLAQFGMGWAYYRLDRCQDSLEAFDRYLEAGPREHRLEALFAQGSCYARLGQEGDAERRFKELTRADPRHPLVLEAAMALADFHRKEGRPAEARRLLHRFLTPGLAGQARAHIQVKLGAVALDEGNVAQARTVFELARETTDPVILQAALSGLGDVHVVLGDLTTAVARYQEAVAVAEKSAVGTYALYQVGRIRLQQDDADGAVEVFQRLRVGPDHQFANEARIALIIAYLRRKDERLAQAQIDGIRKQWPGTEVAARAAYYQALLLFDRGEEGATQKLCQETILKAARSDEAIDARLLLADLRLQWSTPQEVAQWLGSMYAAVGLPPAHRAKLAKRLGGLAKDRQAFAEAIRWYERAMSSLPAMAGEATYRIASCYEEGGDLALAMEWYGRIRQDVWRVRGQLALGKLLERQERWREAETLYVRLSKESIPEAQVAEERLAAVRDSQGQKHP